jgi:nicotinamidase-related amidase
MLLDADECQLVLVDYQTRLMPAIADSAQVLANAVRLAQMAQAMGVPMVATEQNPEKLGASAPELGAILAQARARIFPKMAFSACADGLTELLRPAERKAPAGNARSLPKHLQKAVPASEPARGTVVIAGCEAHVCLLQTALELLEEEFEVWVVTDACGSRTDRNRDAAYDRLAGNGAELVTTEMVAFEWLRSAQHPQFRDVQALIK